MKKILSLVLSICATISFAQQQPVNGVATPKNTIIAFTHAHILSPSGEVISGTLLIQNGKVLGMGTDVTIPFQAVIYDLKGKYLTPSFIELNSNYGQPSVDRKKQTRANVYEGTNNKAYYWNQSIHPHVDAATTFQSEPKAADKLRKLGFGTVVSHQTDGIMQGNGALVYLTNNAKTNLQQAVNAQFFSFNKGSAPHLYPTSLMGSIALMRQTLYDAQHYQQYGQTKNYDLEALSNIQSTPTIFYAKNHLNIQTAAEISREFGLQSIMVSGGDDYKRLAEIKATNAPLILPLDFPKAYDVSNPLDAQYIYTSQLRHWESAPYNPAFVYQAQIPFCFTATNNPDVFWSNLRKSVEHGLPWKEALKALTVNPANFMGISNQTGDVTAGKTANFFITEKNPFLHKTRVLSHWVNGTPFVYTHIPETSAEGQYNLNVNGALFSLTIENTDKGLAFSTTFGGSEKKPQKGKVSEENQVITFYCKNGTDRIEGPVQFVGKANFKGKIIDGKAQDAAGNWVDWTAIQQKQSPIAAKADSANKTVSYPTIFYPHASFGDTIVPTSENYYFKNVNVWTCDSVGNFVGDVIVENGKITQVAMRLENPGYQVIEGKHLHLTPGLIDEHSHIATTSSVNEFGQNNSAEVRIGDIINPNDINIYRQLAGGVTTSQILHGSANPIGGQSAIIQLKWGMPASAMKFQNAPLFIKFALGENVKQSNWSVGYSSRFPRTRMGVEQVFIDAMTRAKAYNDAKTAFDGTSKKERKQGATPPPVDLELEALAEILNGQRYITCHSYIQSEILMLMSVADSLGFKVNTFTHVLEGYKIAEELKQHGANASTFADWWAYKYEVNDAIPQNAALLTQMGVNTAINSDDAEMGRRLNQEAAKTVKYGGLSEIEALNTVTINPAKMLHIDQTVGSISVGKQADLVLWNGHPLAVTSAPILTLIAGVPYYSAARDEYLQQITQQERQRIIQKMIQAKANGAPTQKIHVRQWHGQHCDTYESDF